ncbi:1-acyl-sn-glycerol-3-phosphate acyltransferase [Massilia sp. IC2-477]|uniref:1-acyl-sn-glycerol-3-phosphate acyltransferase n=1 Tax=Massilia sp. IC2-477 TaxID=2887198 RepID=UPI001D127A5B|nr:1-acyl-sn-glycerol-3-phosphate acyltransferase [Massilia sp. IC2-477]MCC2955303.1 1-acyl-sn-glycerol-3-phosphate acyltransferase [Massilia sp. IC2-477]
MSEYLLRPAALPTRGQRTALRLLNLAGWNVHYKPLPGPHGIAVVYPHTSNWDFLVGLFAKWAVGLKFRWLAKDSLFRGVMGTIMRYWGGIAVDRRASMGATRKLAEDMLAAPWCWIAITPEGTRSYRPHWKSGFYHLATTANVPLLLVYIDYGTKVLSVTDTLTLTGDTEKDMAAIAAVYAGRQGRYPDQAAPIKLAPPRDPSEPQRRRA